MRLQGTLSTPRAAPLATCAMDHESRAASPLRCRVSRERLAGRTSNVDRYCETNVGRAVYTTWILITPLEIRCSQ